MYIQYDYFHVLSTKSFLFFLHMLKIYLLTSYLNLMILKATEVLHSENTPTV